MNERSAHPIATESRRHPDGWTDVWPAQAAQHVADVRVIDVRQPDEYTGPLGHIPGAELVPLGDLPAAVEAWRPEEPLLVVCHVGGRSAVACRWLEARGFRRVYNLAGGMALWNRLQLPIER